jgi:hypothetical protein
MAPQVEKKAQKIAGETRGLFPDLGTAPIVGLEAKYL